MLSAADVHTVGALFKAYVRARKEQRRTNSLAELAHTLAQRAAGSEEKYDALCSQFERLLKQHYKKSALRSCPGGGSWLVYKAKNRQGVVLGMDLKQHSSTRAVHRETERRRAVAIAKNHYAANEAYFAATRAEGFADRLELMLHATGLLDAEVVTFSLLAQSVSEVPAESLPTARKLLNTAARRIYELAH